MGEHRDREGSVVTGTDLVLERDPVQRAADRRLEKREPARDERDPRRIGADPRERVAVVAADRDRVACDAGRLRREAALRLGLVGRRDGWPAGVPVDAVGVREQADADHEHDDHGEAGPARCSWRGRNEHRLALLVDGLDPAEIGVVGARQPARGRGRLDAVPLLQDSADDELDLGRCEDREREPERDRSLEAVGEQPEHDEAQSPDAGGRLSTSPRDHPAQGRGA